MRRYLPGWLGGAAVLIGAEAPLVASAHLVAHPVAGAITYGAILFGGFGYLTYRDIVRP